MTGLLRGSCRFTNSQTCCVGCSQGVILASEKMVEKFVGLGNWFGLVSNPEESFEESWSWSLLCGVVEEGLVEFWLEFWVVCFELVDCFFEAFLPRFAFGYSFSSVCAVLESEFVLD